MTTLNLDSDSAFKGEVKGNINPSCCATVSPPVVDYGTCHDVLTILIYSVIHIHCFLIYVFR